MSAPVIMLSPHRGFAAAGRGSYGGDAMSANEKERMSQNGLEAVFMTNRPALLRFFVARGWSSDADDLLQELWVKVGATDSGPIAEPRAYLFRMADNLILDRRRADQRRTRRDDHWTEATRGTVADISNAPSIERTLIARDQLRRVDQAIDALGERTASIFRSYRIDGLHQREIAAMTGISLSAVEKHLQKAYQAMVNIRREVDADLPSARRRDGEGREE